MPTLKWGCCLIVLLLLCACSTTTQISSDPQGKISSADSPDRQSAKKISKNGKVNGASSTLARNADGKTTEKAPGLGAGFSGTDPSLKPEDCPPGMEPRVLGTGQTVKAAGNNGQDNGDSAIDEEVDEIVDLLRLAQAYRDKGDLTMHNRVVQELMTAVDMIHSASRQGAFSAEGPIRVDVQQELALINQSYRQMIETINTDDYRILLDKQDKNNELQEGRQLSMLYFGTPEMPSLALSFGAGRAVQMMDSMSTALTLGGTVSATELREAMAGGGNQETRKMLDVFKFAYWRAGMREGGQFPPREFIGGTPENKAVLTAFGQALLEGKPISEEYAVMLAPILHDALTQLGSEAGTPGAPISLNDVTRVQTELSAMELEPGTKANKAWAPDNLDNPTSKSWNSPVERRHRQG